MAPLTDGVADLAARYYYCGSGYTYHNGACYSRWNWWGRWVFMGVVIFFFLLFALLLVCRRNRRRRNPGPTNYGPQSGWWGRPGAAQQPQYAGGGGAAAYNTAAPQYSAPPPQYSPTGGSNAGYYGTGNNDIPLQQPTNAYYPSRNANGAEEEYAAPEGPPPSKK